MSYVIAFLWILLSSLVCSLSLGCPRGWFGCNCQYKCRCKGDNCTADDGTCTGSSKCQVGWFGPACQYEDLAQLDIVIDLGSRPLSVVTDGNDGTCLGASTRQMSLKWAIPYHVTWMRLHLHESYLMNRFTVLFKTDWNRQIPCKNIRTAKVSDKALDIHCGLNVTVMQVIVSWEGPAYLCSLYISGGRNIALNQNASQSSTDFKYSRAPTAANVVDGDTSSDYLYGNCPQTQRSDPFPQWSVVFSRNFSVNRFLVYHRIDAHAFLRRSYWFSLQAQDAAGRPVFTDKGAAATRQNVYTVTTGAAPSPVSRVSIQSAGNRLRFTAAPAVLVLCEVEVYGDTMCEPGWYGRDCEHKCNCADSHEACFVSTGGCTSGCAVGFLGEGCADECPPGTFGQNCSLPCAQLCLANSNGVNVCHHLNGTCLLGCQVGFEGPWCNLTCTPGTYGHGCSYECSKLCAPAGSNSTPSCHHLHGVCLSGCQPGYRGQMCNAICPPGQFGQGCSLMCSQFCMFDNRNVTVCDHVRGRCLLGCLPGYEGAWCNQTCTPGLYGLVCESQCPEFCGQDNTSTLVCHHQTGVCVHGCQPGYTGEMCDTHCQDGYQRPTCSKCCRLGTYGPDCDLVCPDLCAVNNAGQHSCHHVTGTCLRGCLEGYTGHWCNHTCDNGTHGVACSFPCPQFCDVTNLNEPICHHVHGTCLQGCQDGYQGPTCSKSCDRGTFGQGCTFLCPQFCQTSNASQTVCHHVNGTCLHGCQDGYTGSLCSQSCKQGTFGPGCRLQCPEFCAGEAPVCDTATGTCVSGCRAGRSGPWCTEMDTMGSYIVDTDAVWLIAIAVGVAIMAAAGVLCWRRRQLMKSLMSDIAIHVKIKKSSSKENIINAGISDSDQQGGSSWSVEPLPMDPGSDNHGGSAWTAGARPKDLGYMRQPGLSKAKGNYYSHQ